MPDLTHHPGLPLIAYHQMKAVSPSQIKTLGRSPLHYYDKFLAPDKERPEPTIHMLVGSALHMAILEPDRFPSEVVTPPDINRRTNAGKAEWFEWEAANVDKIVLPQDDYDRVLRMADAVCSHPAAATILEQEAICEASYTWTNTDYGIDIPCKVRPDLHTADRRIVVDVKTTQDARREAIARQCSNLDYHVQAAWNLDALGAEAFLILAVESTRPYAVAVYPLAATLLDAGRRRIDKGLALLAECKRTGVWPGYGDTLLEPLELPRWNND